jgi:hypothetical protein
MDSAKTPIIQHLHTYFLFPFSIDKRVVIKNQSAVWSKYQHWIDGLDHWIASRAGDASAVGAKIGRWRRSSYTSFDQNSAAYQNMAFFHPFVRRVFFDTSDSSGAEKESLLRCYTIPVGGANGKLILSGRDLKKRSAEAEVSDLRLFLFANGIGILSIGVESFNIPLSQALWFNESLRKVYPSSGRQVREGRIPSEIALVLERDGERLSVVEENFSSGAMVGFQPPLSKIISSLIYFADYGEEEFEAVLDERMIVYTYAALNPASLPQGFVESEEYQVLLSRLLYVDIDGPGYRYEPEFVRSHMKEQLYRRWAHQGTYYGFTSYSNITVTMGIFDCEEHSLMEGFLIHRMFDSRYYLMALVALFYRATLIDFTERSALVSKRLFLDQEDGRLSPENIRLASDVRAEFLHFSNYWYFDELANKDEEIEHFTLQCQQFRIEPLKREIEEEIEKLNASLHDYSAFRNTEAVNRLAMLSLIVGAGAVLTGFFGMNFGHRFARWFFEPDAGSLLIHYFAVISVALLAFGALAFGLYVVASNWSDYREILVPHRWKHTDETQRSIKRSQ